MNTDYIFNFIDYRALQPVYAIDTEYRSEIIDLFLESHPLAAIEVEPDMPTSLSKSSPAESAEEGPAATKKKPKKRKRITMERTKHKGIKSPFIDAFVYCALKQLGVTLVTNTPKEIEFHVSSYALFSEHVETLCKHKTPIKDPMRLNTLRHWFAPLPDIDIIREYPFDIQVKKEKIPNMLKIIHDIELLVNREKKMR